jgi:NAD(P)-dependent dehydrogenase (short-subunit alcohol dehydrogenase family)
MASDLEGKDVVITGGSGGLGRAVVDMFAGAGAICHLPQRGRPDPASPSSIHIVGGVDLANEAAVVSLYTELPPLWASIHLAGGYEASPFVDTTLQSLRFQMEINLTTAFLCCREAIRNMQKRSTTKGGRIVNVSSRAALEAAGGAIAYAASKAAVAALTQALAVEVRPQRIWVNAVAPSIIDTPSNRAAMPKANYDRWPKPQEIARTILWLASPENLVISGAVVPVYGDS